MILRDQIDNFVKIHCFWYGYEFRLQEFKEHYLPKKMEEKLLGPSVVSLLSHHDFLESASVFLEMQSSFENTHQQQLLQYQELKVHY